MPLFAFLIVIFVIMSEIYLFIIVGGQIGAGMVILLIFATAFLGVALMRRQGLTVLAQAQADLADNVLPIAALGHGLLILLAGILLLIPGFLTDGLGFLLLVPPARQFIAEMIIGGIIPMEIFTEFAKNARKQPEFDEIEPFDASPPHDTGDKGRADRSAHGPVIEADFDVEDEQNSGT